MQTHTHTLKHTLKHKDPPPSYSYTHHHTRIVSHNHIHTDKHTTKAPPTQTQLLEEQRHLLDAMTTQKHMYQVLVLLDRRAPPGAPVMVVINTHLIMHTIAAALRSIQLLMVLRAVRRWQCAGFATQMVNGHKDQRGDGDGSGDRGGDGHGSVAVGGDGDGVGDGSVAVGGDGDGVRVGDGSVAVGGGDGAEPAVAVDATGAPSASPPTPKPQHATPQSDPKVKTHLSKPQMSGSDSTSPLSSASAAIPPASFG